VAVVESTAAPPINVVEVTEYVPVQLFFGTLNGNEIAFEVPFGMVNDGVVNITALVFEQEFGLRSPVKSNSTLTF
jgi:hypothetical protein